MTGRTTNVRLPILFPPTERNEWRPLDDEDRFGWLSAARDRFFDEADAFIASKEPGRVVVLDGAIVDNLLGFYCALGEAVNGPGGYFGRTMDSFDDCLFGGFGLEFPYTIVWVNSPRAMGSLHSSALVSFLDSECTSALDPNDFAEGLAWRKATRAAGLSGHRTMFDEIVDTIRSVASRNGGAVSLRLE